MLDKAKTWFKGLSKAGKTGVILASLFVVGAAASPLSKDTSSQPTPAPVTSIPQPKQDTVEKKTVSETETVPFEKTSVQDSSLAQGKSSIRTAGVSGIKTLTYEITLTNSIQTNKKLIKEEVTTTPIAEVTAIGTYVYVAPQPTQSAPTTQSTGARTGAVCKDGSSSSATGSGACSHHGGVAYWTY